MTRAGSRFPAWVRLDPREVVSVVLKVNGRITQLGDLYVGRPVRAGELLARFESAELETIQRTYLETFSKFEYVRTFSTTAEEKLIEARMDLQWRGLSEPDLRSLERSLKPIASVAIHAPRDGYLVEINATEGQVINPGSQTGLFNLSGTTLFRIATPAALLVEAEVPLQTASLLAPGQAAWLFLPDGERAPATVEEIQAYSRPGSLRRTVRLRPVSGPHLAALRDGMRMNIGFEREEGAHVH